MDKLPMCRICLAENVRMYIVVNQTLRDLYEKLTGNPFVTKDSRPIHACFICCAQLKKCYRFLKKCLDAEEQFAQMMNEDYERKPLINQDQFELFHGFIRTPIKTISIVDVDQAESIVVKEEQSSVCEIIDDNIKPKEQNESDNDLKPVDIYNNYLDVEDTHRVFVVGEVAKTYKRRIKSEDIIATEQKKTDQKITQDTRNCTPKRLIASELRVQNSINNTALDIDCRTNIYSFVQDCKPYKCDICQHSFKLKIDLTRHVEEHTGEKSYKCDIHTGEKSYKCDICQISFREKSYLTNHIRIHTIEKPIKCETCQSSFPQNSHLTNHIRLHTGEKPFKFYICPSSFRQNSHLTSHIRLHTGEKRFKCDICQISFREKTSLTRHIRLHTCEKPFKCYICPSSFSQNSQLTSHIRLHTGEKPFKCNICQISFRQKSSLITHFRLHTGEKPYKCYICPRSFRQRSHLTSHIRLHTGEKPFKCDICHRNFREKSHLTCHI